MTYRTERDSMGEVQVPAGALYGVQTQRAIDNVTISTRTMPVQFIRCLAQIKRAAALANATCGVLDEDLATAIAEAAAQVAAGQYLELLPVGVFQTGSGTSTNMNRNEVLARLATDNSARQVHPNDHVNCSQSSNDVIPSCSHVSATLSLEQRLRPALQDLDEALKQRVDELRETVKTGRTHLMDALPITFGQELGAWPFQLEECQDRLEALQPRLRAPPIGGSAVGTGVAYIGLG